MRLGGPVFHYKTAEEWADAHVENGYGAAFWPLTPDAKKARARAFCAAAERRGLLIAEVGVWNNVLDPDPARRETNIRAAIAALRTADAVGARCCVNIAGSRGAQWDGPHPDNLTEATFEAVVATTQRIIDEAAPERARYALEPMPWMYPYDLASTQRLIEAVDRPAFGVHVDMCNMMNAPDKVYASGAITRAYFEALGPHICAVHAKDLVLRPTLTVHIDEAVPGEGVFDFETLLRQAAALDDVPVLLEHLASPEEYDRAARHLRGVAAGLGLAFRSAE